MVKNGKESCLSMNFMQSRKVRGQKKHKNFSDVILQLLITTNIAHAHAQNVVEMFVEVAIGKITKSTREQCNIKVRKYIKIEHITKLTSIDLEYIGMENHKMSKFIERLNTNCMNRKKNGFCPWTEKDIFVNIENGDIEIRQRNYCYWCYKDYDLCRSCERLLTNKFIVEKKIIGEVKSLKEEIATIKEKINIC